MDQIYSINIPTKYENVLVKFTNRNNTHIEGELLEYKSFKCMMSYNDVTKKKKVYSWNKIVPLNKPMVARVDEIFLESNYVQVSIAYFNKIDNIEDDDIQKYLLKKFNDNKILISILKNIFYTIQIDLNEFWEKIIFPLDNARRTDDINISLLEYFINNKELVTNLLVNNVNVTNFDYVSSNKSTTRIILEIYAIWIKNNSFGLMLRPINIAIKLKEKLIYNYKFLNDSENDSENEVVTELSESNFQTEINNNIFANNSNDNDSNDNDSNDNDSNDNDSNDNDSNDNDLNDNDSNDNDSNDNNLFIKTHDLFTNNLSLTSNDELESDLNKLILN
jgi:hypothetical protein